MKKTQTTLFDKNHILKEAVENGLFDCTDSVDIKIKKKNRFFHLIKNLIKWFQSKKFSVPDPKRDRLTKLAGIDSDSKKAIVSERRKPTFVISEENVSIKSKSSFIDDEKEG